MLVTSEHVPGIAGWVAEPQLPVGETLTTFEGEDFAPEGSVLTKAILERGVIELSIHASFLMRLRVLDMKTRKEVYSFFFEA